MSSMIWIVNHLFLIFHKSINCYFPCLVMKNLRKYFLIFLISMAFEFIILLETICRIISDVIIRRDSP